MVQLTDEQVRFMRDGIRLAATALSKLRVIKDEATERLSPRGQEYLQEATVALEIAALRFQGK